MSNYELFFNDHVMKLQIQPSLLEVVNNKLYFRYETRNHIAVRASLSFKGTLDGTNFADWFNEYPELKEAIDELNDGIPTMTFNINQELTLFLDKNRFDNIMGNPMYFELDTATLNKVDFNGEYKFDITGYKNINKETKLKIEKALDFPIKSHNEIFDLGVKLD